MNNLVMAKDAIDLAVLASCNSIVAYQKKMGNDMSILNKESYIQAILDDLNIKFRG